MLDQLGDWPARHHRQVLEGEPCTQIPRRPAAPTGPCRTGTPTGARSPRSPMTSPARPVRPARPPRRRPARVRRPPTRPASPAHTTDCPRPAPTTFRRPGPGAADSCPAAIAATVVAPKRPQLDARTASRIRRHHLHAARSITSRWGTGRHTPTTSNGVCCGYLGQALPQRETRLIGPLQIINHHHHRRGGALPLHQRHHPLTGRPHRIHSAAPTGQQVGDLQPEPVHHLSIDTQAVGHHPQREQLGQLISRLAKNPHPARDRAPPRPTSTKVDLPIPGSPADPHHPTPTRRHL